jgi:CBS domain-containing protein
VKLGSIAESIFELPATKSTDIISVLDVMAENRTNFALILDESNQIIGIITDGDIKRQIRLEVHSAGEEIDLIPNKDFICAHEDDDLDELLTKIEIKSSLGAIPIKDKHGCFKHAVRVSNFI